MGSIPACFDQLFENHIALLRSFELPVCNSKHKEEVEVVLLHSAKRFQRLSCSLVIIKDKMTHALEIECLSVLRGTIEDTSEVRNRPPEVLLCVVSQS